MTSSTASDGRHHDLGAIEAAVRETARGRAFLAHYARRVQQSDTLTMLAMLGRLERVADELASRLTELEAGNVQNARPLVSPSDGSLPYQSGPGPTNTESVGTMQRIDDLAAVFGQLNRHAVQLATQCAGEDERHVPASVEIDARAYLPPEPALLSSGSASDQHRTDDDVLDKIARALTT